MTKRYLILEDGSCFEGQAIGSDQFRVGELVFNTSMTGYQEILTDSSYSGQIITMTYPMIGNYGINRDGLGSMAPSIFGFVISEHCEEPSNFRSQMNVDEFLKLRNIPGIKDVDTRMITRYIREKGTMKATLSDSIDDMPKQVEEIKNTALPTNLVEKVSITKPFNIPHEGYRVVVVDFGSVNDILKELNQRKLDITVVPYNITTKSIDFLHIDAIVLSNGPGNPEDLPDVIETIKDLIGKYPILGIGLGHQLLAIASGAKIKKLKVGHRGNNYPVVNTATGKVEIQATNNSYIVDINSLDEDKLKVTYLGLDEGTCEGFEDVKNYIYSIQFHPEAFIDENSKNKIYERFMSIIDDYKGEKNA